MLETQAQKRAHIYEIDLIRSITVFSVVAIHSLTYTNFMTSDPLRMQILFLVGHALHYNREMFMFVTGLVLTYVYYNRPFSAKTFWLKRFSLVLIPYILWTLIYVLINNPTESFISYVKLFSLNLLTGDASFQLYYILLIVQFYAVFPLFLWFLKRVEHYPWRTLFFSFFIQVVMISLDYFFLEMGSLRHFSLIVKFVNFQDRIFLLYQFFFVLGGFSALYIDTIRNFLIKHKISITVSLLLALTLYSVYYFLQIYTLKYSLSLATSVLQPSVVLYSIVVILFSGLLATVWTRTMVGYKLVKIIADTSFGVYFVHIFILTFIVAVVLPYLSTIISLDIVKDVIVLLLGFSASVAFSYLLLRIPFLSWTIGKPQKVQNFFLSKKSS